METEDLFSRVSKTGINFSKYENIPVKCEGEQPPSPVTTVEQAGLCRLVMDNVTKVGYTSLTPVQRHSLPIVMGGRDLMACAQTGSGKTAAFLLPIVHSLVSNYQTRTVQGCHKPMCLIVTPTRELAIQIFTEVKKFAHSSPLKSAIAYGGVSTGSQLASLTHGCDILVATPGRLMDFVGQGKIGFHMVKYLVLDEADRMLDMGFMPDVKKIVGDPNMPPKGDRVTLMFSATFPSIIRKVADQFLHRFIFLTVGVVGGACTDVTQKFYQVAKKDKKDRLTALLAELGSSKTLVFIRTKHKTHRLAQQLYREGFACNSIHGDRSQGQRELALAQFRDGVSTVLLATAVVARGLDIPEVANVINYDMPGEIEEYVHRIGRTGRVGNYGQAISFWDMDEDTKVQKDLVRILTESGQVIPDWLRLDVDGKEMSGQRRGKGGGGGGKQGGVREKHGGGREGKDKENLIVNNQEKKKDNLKVNGHQGLESKKKEKFLNNDRKSESKINSSDEIKNGVKKEVVTNHLTETGPKLNGNADPKDSNPAKEKIQQRNRGKSNKIAKEDDMKEKTDSKVETENVEKNEKAKRKRNRNRGKKPESASSGVDQENGGQGGGGGGAAGGGGGWAGGRQASLPEMARDRPGPALPRRTASQYEFARDGGGGGRQGRPHHNRETGEYGRPHSVREGDQGRPHHARENQGRPNHPRDGDQGRPQDAREDQGRPQHVREDQGRPQHVREDQGRHQQGRGGHARAQPRNGPSAPVADIIGILNQQARGGGGGHQDQGERQGNRETSSYRPHTGDRQETRGGGGGGRGGGGGVVGGGPPVQARLAQEKVGTQSGRREGGRRRQEGLARDLANTSHWPAL